MPSKKVPDTPCSPPPTNRLHAAPAILSRAPGDPFPRRLASDTISIARRPAVPFNPVSPAGPAPLSLASPAYGPPDKSLLVIQTEV